MAPHCVGCIVRHCVRYHPISSWLDACLQYTVAVSVPRNTNISPPTGTLRWRWSLVIFTPPTDDGENDHPGCSPAVGDKRDYYSVLVRCDASVSTKCRLYLVTVKGIEVKDDSCNNSCRTVYKSQPPS